jgi:hypothetical protein
MDEFGIFFAKKWAKNQIIDEIYEIIETFYALLLLETSAF